MPQDGRKEYPAQLRARRRLELQAQKAQRASTPFERVVGGILSLIGFAGIPLAIWLAK